MRKSKQGIVLALATAATLAGSLLASGPAMAASSPIGACGGGKYHVIDKQDLGAATVYLLYNGSTNCVVTWKDHPNKTYVKALIHRERQPWTTDAGHFSTYAGPVKIAAKGKCIQWGGDYGSKQYTSHFEHCG